MIAKKYLDFMKRLNKNKINWCLIKDYDYLMKNGYDNEIDLIAEEKDRNKIRNLAKKESWNESALNPANTHLIFWKFEGLKPFRIDIHMGKALATAVPWLAASEILNNKIKKGELWVVSPEYELAILLLASFRGRQPKPWRIKRAKELKNYLNETKKMLSNYLSDKESEKYYDFLVNGKIVMLSSLRKLGIFGIIKYHLLFPRLLLCRLINPAKSVFVSSKQFNQLFYLLKNSKINVKKTNNFLMKYVSDIILKTNKKTSSNLKKIIQDLYGENNVH